jgi:hypothetical protein
MYYLVIRNLGTDKCIDMNVEDIYENGQYYSCLPEFSFVAGKLVKTLKIRCTEVPGTSINAIVYSD